MNDEKLKRLDIPILAAMIFQHKYLKKIGYRISRFLKNNLGRKHLMVHFIYKSLNQLASPFLREVSFESGNLETNINYSFG